MKWIAQLLARTIGCFAIVAIADLSGVSYEAGLFGAICFVAALTIPEKADVP